MEIGDLLSDQFQILSLAGLGGMGKVYKALDNRSGSEVAIKVLSLDASKYSRRFLREAKVMSRLRHPNIVEYRGYGKTEGGAPYIVMEWVLGEDLRQRMNRCPLGLDEALQIISGLGDALALADKQGIIHRDLKPSNLMLVGGKVETIKLLDFGIARGSDPDLERMTKTGVSIGTPGYMAPEQSRGESKIDGRADLYALGCVVYECLIGQRPFQGEDIVAVLARGATVDPPRVSAHRNDISPDFDDLLCDMMAFHPSGRPVDGIRAAERARSIPSTRTNFIGAHLLSERFGLEEMHPTGVILINNDLRDRDELVLEILANTDHQMEHFDNGKSAIVVRLANFDLQALMCHCAALSLTIRKVVPQLSASLHLCSADWQSSRVARDAMKQAQAGNPASGDVSNEDCTIVGETAARYICENFSIRTADESEKPHFTLLGELEVAQIFARNDEVLGPACSFVGRERELSFLHDALQTTALESKLQIHCVNGPTGIGKSRLRETFMDQVASKGPHTRFWFVRARKTNTPYDLIGQLVAHAAGHLQSDTLTVRRNKLESLVRAILPEDRAAHVCEFMGELCDTSQVANTGNSILMAARGNPAMMRNQILNSWREFFAAIIGDTPLLLILEDIHRCDTESLQALGTALLSSMEKPVMVLTLSRMPQIPGWFHLPISTISLTVLSDEESHALARSIAPPSSQTASSISRAQGNPWILEELIANTPPKNGILVPNHVVQSCQERLIGLSLVQKRFLRAASILGIVSPLPCISFVIGEALASNSEKVLSELCRLGLLSRGTSESKATQVEFSDELTRLTVYAGLIPEDRRFGHSRTADWILENWSDSGHELPLDVLLSLAYHYEKSQQDSLAASYYYQAAKSEMAEPHIQPAIHLASRAMALSCDKSESAALQAILTRAHLWAGHNSMASEYGTSALETLSVVAEKTSVAGDTIVAFIRCGADIDTKAALGELLTNRGTSDTDSVEFVQAIAKVATAMCQMGKYRDAIPLYREFLNDISDGRSSILSDVSQGYLAMAMAFQDLHQGRPEHQLAKLEQSTHHFAAAGAINASVSTHIALGMGYANIGDWQQAEKTLRSAQEAALAQSLPYLTALSHRKLGSVLLALGKFDNAQDVLNLARESFTQQKNEGAEFLCCVQLSQYYQCTGDLTRAEELAKTALRGTSTMTNVRMLGSAQLASILLQQGQREESLFCAKESYELLSDIYPVAEGGRFVSLRLAESLLQCDQTEAAKVIVGEAHSELLACANQISAPGRRLSFIEQVKDNARLVQLAIQLNIDKKNMSRT